MPHTPKKEGSELNAAQEPKSSGVGGGLAGPGWLDLDGRKGYGYDACGRDAVFAGTLHRTRKYNFAFSFFPLCSPSRLLARNRNKEEEEEGKGWFRAK
ncbi:hypothetical protein E2C01_096634 [Portunus trituberculatus]|uniref:Uncharacterized protein n=1 Tax=Portunus trituberculatus TaxID=210409 RepID=A0A5B7JW60_PORTR|nr:hypothetical protein [Portunus trituberculatus]